VSEVALGRARATARQRRRKPRLPRPNGPWWLCLLWLADLAVAYLVVARARWVALAALCGVLLLAELATLRLALAWWRWERQEGLAHHRPGRADWAFAAAGVVFLVLLLQALAVRAP
jgi:hypothetical protein